MIPQAAFVTGNEKKWAEVQAILGERVVRLTRANVDLPEVQGRVEDVAKWKCREAARLVGGPVITEDTALCFDALNGLPGPYIKWFMEDVGLDGLNDMLEGFPVKTAKAICTMAYCDGPEGEPILFQGITTGCIVRPRGPRNFGWDPIFQPDHPTKQTYNSHYLSIFGNHSYADMPAELKNTISHRYKALAKLREYFESQVQ